MGFRFQKRLSILPGVRINLSKSGASTSIGPRGADVNVARDGVTTNAGIPGTGLSYRQKVGGSHSHGMLGVAAVVGGLAVWGVQHLDKITHIFTPTPQTVASAPASGPQNTEQPAAEAQQAATTEPQAAQTSPVNTAAPGMRFVHRGGSVIRDAAKTSGHKLKKEVKGVQVRLISQDADGWAKVRDGDITGWMRASVLGVDPPADAHRGLIIAGLMLGAALPALADDLKPLCPDRPGHATSACTVEAGHVQVEAALYDGFYQRRSGVTTDLTVAASPVVKYGLSDSLDIEAGMPLYQELRVHGPAGTTHQSGIGDLTLHAKWNPLVGDDGPFAAVIAPYLKLPTAGGGLTNGAVEGGLLLPLAYTLGDGWSLFMTPEADDLLNGSGSGMHLQIANDVAIGYSFDNGLTLGADVFMTQSYDPGTKVNQALFDANVAYLTDNNTQLDAGFAVGLNRATPDLEIYTGISRRF